jgi:hypothetical protein
MLETAVARCLARSLGFAAVSADAVRHYQVSTQQTNTLRGMKTLTAALVKEGGQSIQLHCHSHQHTHPLFCAKDSHQQGQW